MLHAGVMAEAAQAGLTFGHVLWPEPADGSRAALIADPLGLVPATLLGLGRQHSRCDARPLGSIPLSIWTLLSSHDSTSFQATGFHAYARPPIATGQSSAL
jgi:hypothetical protein